MNDLRLIQNIFNEYAIYVANLETENENNLDVNKLLAVLIYKNVFPSDFESLHRGKGNLAQVLRSHDQNIAASESRYTHEISRLEKLVDDGERQLPNSLAELRRIYAMAIVEMIPEGWSRVGLDRNGMILLNKLASDERFDAMVESTQLQISTNQGHQQPLQLNDLQAKVDPHRTFQQRKEGVEKKSAAFRESSLQQIRELRAKLSTLRMAKFNEVNRAHIANPSDPMENFADKWTEHPEREEAFYKWLRQAQSDYARVAGLEQGSMIAEELSPRMGTALAKRAETRFRGGSGGLLRGATAASAAASSQSFGSVPRVPSKPQGFA